MDVNSAEKYKTKKVTLSLPIELIEEFNKYCKDNKMFKSKIMANLLNDFIEKTKAK